METLDLVVIGAGWYGLAAAKQYQEMHPGCAVAIIDYTNTLGGIWSQDRLYPGLKSNNLYGTYQYPDFPMDSQTFGVWPGQYNQGAAVHRYLAAYAEKFDLVRSLRLQTKVISAEHLELGGWILRTRKMSGQDMELKGRDDEGIYDTELFARRMIMATGMMSEPFMPKIEGQGVFDRPLFHFKDFHSHEYTLDPSNYQRVAVFGGSKSAWDAVYEYASRGIQVDWVIRSSGHGPCWMAPSFVTPFKKWIERLVNIRFMTWFGPCIWSEDGGYSTIRNLLHATLIGRLLVNLFWFILGADIRTSVNLDRHPETAKLKPWTKPMFAGCSFSILNYDSDILEYVRDGTVRVHIADLSHLGPGTVHLADAARTSFPADAFLCVTGWKIHPPFKFLPAGIEKEIGIPFLPDPRDRHLGNRRDLFEKADAEILERFPRLRSKPVPNRDFVPLMKQTQFRVADGDPIAPGAPATPFLLYHLVVPPSPLFLRTKDTAFAGAIMNFSNPITAHLQGLWISAFFDGTLARDPSRAVAPTASFDDVESGGSTAGDSIEKKSERGGRSGGGWEPTLEEVQYQTVLHNRFGKWRYSGDHAAMYPSFVFEAVPYLDMLLKDLGLENHRKKGWWREMTEAYTVEDYKGVNGEWQRRLLGHD